MKASLRLGGVGLFLAASLVAAPAGEPSPYEGIVKGMLKKVDDITTILGGVTDEKSAAAATPELRAAAKDLLQLRKRAEEVKQPDKAEKDRLAKLYAPKFEEAVKKLREETFRVRGVPGGDEALKELAVLRDKLDPKDKKGGK
jgi:hypothetical protein